MFCEQQNALTVRRDDDEFMDTGGGAPPPPVIRAHDKPIPRADAILMSAGLLCAQAIGKRKGSEERLNAIRDATSTLEAAWEAVIEEQRLLEGVSNGSA
jgi:hypothetical protein